MKIGMLTGGGDCPGLNAVIRSVAKPAMAYFNSTIVGIIDGFEGLVEGRMRELSKLDVSGIINLGGTILGAVEGQPGLRGRILVGVGVLSVREADEVVETLGIEAVLADLRARGEHV